MDIYEEIVMMAITRGKNLFVCPQVNLNNWSCPDFIGLDIKIPKIVVIEISSAINIDDLIKKVNDRENQWYKEIRKDIKNNEFIKNLDIETHIYIRGEIKGKAELKINEPRKDVFVYKLEDYLKLWVPIHWLSLKNNG